MLTPTGFECKRTVAVLGSWFWIVVLGDHDSGDRGSGWDRAVFLDFLGFRRHLWEYLTRDVKYWIGYMRYMLIY